MNRSWKIGLSFGVFTAMLWTPLGLGAQPTLAVGSMDLSEYPVLRFNAVMRNEGSSMNDPGRFELLEKPGSGKTLKLSVQGRGNTMSPTSGTDWFLLVDTTRSLSRRDFRASLDLAARFARTLPPGDRAALYTFSRRLRRRKGLTKNREELAGDISSIVRTGMVTRLFDSLSETIKIARKSGMGSGMSGKRRPAILLLTDGRDEGSKAAIKDCVRVAGRTGEGGIPVHVILFGRVLNRAALHVLTEATDGRFFAGLNGDGPLRLLERRGIAKRDLNFTARSRAALHGAWPKQRIHLELVWISSEGEVGARAPYTYHINWSQYLKALGGGWQNWVFIGIALLLLILLVILLMLFMRKRSTPPTLEKSPVRGVRDVAAGGEGDEYRLAIGESDTQETAPVSNVIELPEPEVIEPVPRDLAAVEALAHAIHEVGPHHGMANHSVYMQSYSYQILQDALRGSERYKTGALVLRESTNKEERRRYDLFLETTVLGSGRWSNIHLDDPAASPVHARIRRVDGAFVIYDMVSGAGIYLNGRKLLRPRGLTHGDELKLGRTHFVFRGDP